MRSIGRENVPTAAITNTYLHSQSTYNISMVNVMLDKTYVARVRFGIRVRVRMQVRDSAIFEKGGCGCGGTRRLKNY